MRTSARGVLAVAALLLTACAGGPTRPGTGASPAPAGSSATAVPTSRGGLRSLLAQPLPRKSGAFPAYAATARVPEVTVHERAAGPVRVKLRSPLPSGAPLTFLVKDDRVSWLEVYLPVRPNGSTGWVRADEVNVAGVPFEVEVLRGAHELVVKEHGKVRGRYPVAIGTKDTPTPGGTFYLKELVRPTNPGGFYGPYAYGLSGFSTVYTRFGRGEGVIGIHGTNDESVIGQDVSSGCIRMRNRDVTALARLLPLGTPVRILD